VVRKAEAVLAELREKEKEIARLRAKLAYYQVGDLLSQVQEVNGVKLVAAQVEVPDPASLRDLADNLRERLGSGVIVLGTSFKGRASFVATVSKDLLARGFHAGKLVREMAQVTGGGGGGRPDMAEAGGRLPEKLPEALAKAAEAVAALCRG
jgi:alanyl-tRNA synthetase